MKKLTAVAYEFSIKDRNKTSRYVIVVQLDLKDDVLLNHSNMNEKVTIVEKNKLVEIADTTNDKLYGAKVITVYGRKTFEYHKDVVVANEELKRFIDDGKATIKSIGENVDEFGRKKMLIDLIPIVAIQTSGIWYLLGVKTIIMYNGSVNVGTDGIVFTTFKSARAYESIYKHQKIDEILDRCYIIKEEKKKAPEVTDVTKFEKMLLKMENMLTMAGDEECNIPYIKLRKQYEHEYMPDDIPEVKLIDRLNSLDIGSKSILDPTPIHKALDKRIARGEFLKMISITKEIDGKRYAAYAELDREEDYRATYNRVIELLPVDELLVEYILLASLCEENRKNGKERALIDMFIADPICKGLGFVVYGTTGDVVLTYKEYIIGVGDKFNTSFNYMMLPQNCGAHILEGGQMPLYRATIGDDGRAIDIPNLTRYLHFKNISLIADDMIYRALNSWEVCSVHKYILINFKYALKSEMKYDLDIYMHTLDVDLTYLKNHYRFIGLSDLTQDQIDEVTRAHINHRELNIYNMMLYMANKTLCQIQGPRLYVYSKNKGQPLVVSLYGLSENYFESLCDEYSHFRKLGDITLEDKNQYKIVNIKLNDIGEDTLSRLLRQISVIGSRTDGIGNVYMWKVRFDLVTEDTCDLDAKLNRNMIELLNLEE